MKDMNELIALQEQNEKLFAKHNRESFVLNALLESDGSMKWRIENIADDLKVDKKAVEAFFVAAILHQSPRWHTANIEPVFGKVFGYCHKDSVETQRVVEGILEHPQNSVVDAEVYQQYGESRVTLHVNVALEDGESEALDKFQFPLPFVCPPQRISPASAGYITLKEKPVSKGLPYIAELPVYDLIRTSKVAFSINEKALDCDMVFKVKHPEDYSSEQEHPKIWDEAVKAYNLKFFRTRVMLDTFKEEGVERFYFAHRKDGRFRDYCIGLQANEQGTDQDKALLEFADKEVCTKEGFDWLLINIVNQINPKVGDKKADKCTWDKRLLWGYEHIDELETIAQEMEEDSQYPEEFRSQYKAEEPIKAQCLIADLRKAQAGEPVGSICYWDAVNQGLQLQSLLATDIKTLKLTSVLGKERNDYYVEIAKAMGLDESYRKYVKAPMTPRMYGGVMAAKTLLGDDADAFEEAIHQYPVWNLVDQFPQQFPEEWLVKDHEIRWTLPDGAKTLVKVKVQEDFEAEVFGYSWSWSAHANDCTTKCSLGPDLIHSLDGFIGREMASRCMFNPAKRNFVKKFLKGEVKIQAKAGLRHKDEDLLKLIELGKKFNWYSFHILDLVDVYNIDQVPQNVLEQMLKELPEKPFPITRIHDSFGAHPNHAHEAQEQYRWNLYHLYESNFLDVVCEELGIVIVVPHKNPYISKMILDGEYALC